MKALTGCRLIACDPPTTILTAEPPPAAHDALRFLWADPDEAAPVACPAAELLLVPFPALHCFEDAEEEPDEKGKRRREEEEEVSAAPEDVVVAVVLVGFCGNSKEALFALGKTLRANLQNPDFVGCGQRKKPHKMNPIKGLRILSDLLWN